MLARQVNAKLAPESGAWPLGSARPAAVALGSASMRDRARQQADKVVWKRARPPNGPGRWRAAIEFGRRADLQRPRAFASEWAREKVGAIWEPDGQQIVRWRPAEGLDVCPHARARQMWRRLTSPFGGARARLQFGGAVDLFERRERAQCRHSVATRQQLPLTLSGAGANLTRPLWGPTNEMRAGSPASGALAEIRCALGHAIAFGAALDT